MKIETHLEDEQDYAQTLSELLQQDVLRRRKLIVEGCVLAATNILNLVLHQQGKLPELRDMKHNRMEGFLRREQPLGSKSKELAELQRALEDLKYKVVHGKSKEEALARRAFELYDQIKKEVLENAP